MGSGASSQPGETRRRSSVRTAQSTKGTIYPRRISQTSSASSNASERHVPPPVPPKTTKDQVYDSSKYEDVDKHAIQVPKRFLKGTFSDLLEAILQGPWTEMEKLRAVFRWLTSIDVYSMTIKDTPPPFSPLEYLKKIQENKGNHAHLFSGLCQMAGIPCVIVSGMNKSAAYQIGKPVDRKEMGAQWNAVYVDGEWRFVDTFWACSCVVGKKSGEWTLVDADGKVMEESQTEDEGITQHRINEFYFLTDPDKLIWTHFPDDPVWQLLGRPVTKQEFEEHFYIRERFYYLGMNTTEASQMKCLLTTKKGETDIQFCLPPSQSKGYKFKYMLYLSKSALKENKANIFLDRFIFFEQRPDLLLLALRFPIKGTFKLDVFGVDVSGTEVFDLVCTYLIHCPEPKPNCLPLPDVPPLGWGPVFETMEAGLKPKTHHGGIIHTKDGNVEIRFGVDRKVQVHQALLHAIIDGATLNSYSVSRMENGEVVVNVRLPMGGEYALKLFVQEEGEEGEATNVCNYLLRCDKDNLNNAPFPNIPSGNLGKNYLGDKMAVKALSHPVGMVETKDGHLPMSFEAPDDVELMCEIHSINSEGKAVKMAVLPKVENGVWEFDIDLPTAGEYSLNIFAKNKGDDDRIYNVHSYLVNSKGRRLKDGEMGEQQAGSNVPVETVETADNELWIPSPEGYENVVAALHRKNANDPPTINQISFIKQDEQNYIRVKLPEYGDYVMNIYNSKENGNVENIARYQINRRPHADLYQTNIQTIMDAVGEGEESETHKRKDSLMVEPTDRVPSVASDSSSKESADGNSEDAQKKRAKRQLLKAMETKDSERLKKALDACGEIDIEDPDLIDKAKRLQKLLDAKKALMEASAKRDLKLLKDSIANAKNANFDHMLDLQIAMAQKLRDQLARIEKLRHQVLSMEQKTISEIKSYSTPPDGIKQTMQATFILLGHKKKDIKEWQTIIALMGKTGKESMMRKISLFEPQTVYLDYAQKAKDVIQPFSMDRIREVSAGAATFYVWASGMIEEIESTGGAGMSPKKDGR